MIAMILNFFLGVFSLGFFVSCASLPVGKDEKNKFEDAEFAAKDVVEKNGFTYHFLSLNEKNAEVCFEGTAKVHRRLGNYKVTVDSRVGKLSWIKTYTKKGLFGNSEWTAHPFSKNYFISNKVTLAGVAMSTGGEDFVDSGRAGIALAGGGVPPDAMDNFVLSLRSDYSNKLSGLPPSKYFPSSRFFTECPSNEAFFKETADGNGFTTEYSIKPKDKNFVVNGRTYTTSLFLIKKYHRGHLYGEESAWLCDEIPGRIMACIAQKYSDDGLPLGRTDLTLKSFRTW